METETSALSHQRVPGEGTRSHLTQRCPSASSPLQRLQCFPVQFILLGFQSGCRRQDRDRAVRGCWRGANPALPHPGHRALRGEAPPGPCLANAPDWHPGYRGKGCRYPPGPSLLGCTLLGTTGPSYPFAFLAAWATLILPKARASGEKLHLFLSCASLGFLTHEASSFLTILTNFKWTTQWH